jgi:4-alpha-glucanotransferase
MGEPRSLSKNRSAGILLHPSSLPGPFGIGDLGPVAYTWVDALARAHQKWWQVLPLGPTGFGDSPYQALSTFAGNTNLLSPESMIQDGLLDRPDVVGMDFPADRVAFENVAPFKDHLLGRAWHLFHQGRGGHLRGEFDAFVAANAAAWLDDYALLRALRDAHGGKGLQEWPPELVRRDKAALAKVREQYRGEMEKRRFGQFLIFRQWKYLKSYANSKGVRLIGDVPIFVAADSADAWTNADLLYLDANRHPTVVAGVPPDYFSATGQLWGNPLYNWEASRKTGHRWWVARLRATLEQVDLVRIDHFRAFESYWEIPAGSPTAEGGRWVKGPGVEFFKTIGQQLGKVPVIAEDLGLITEAVEDLRDELGLPGMRVLQFAFSDNHRNLYLPHNHVRNTVVYTGTHDNDTTVGWYASLPENQRTMLHRYEPGIERDPPRELIRMAWESVADYAIAPLQDLLRLGTEARMNRPGQPVGNWRWRLLPDQLTNEAVEWLGGITELYGR